MRWLQLGVPAGGDRSFLDRPFVQKFIPFLTSLSFHAIILILGLLTYTAFKGIEPARPLENQVIVADSTAVTINGLPQYPGTANLLEIPAIQDRTPNEATGASFESGSKLEIETRGGAEAGQAAIFDVGNLNGFGHSGNLIGGHGPGNGTNDGDGLLARIGEAQAGGMSKVFIPTQGARRIAYVCDASGSMLQKIDSLRVELNRAVNGLKLIQSFSIIFFQDEARPIMFGQELIRATPENKRKAGEFLQSIIASGTTNPIPGIEAAFKQKPELIFLLTDGDFPDNGVVLRKIRELNKDKKVKINTIAFVGAADSDTEFLKLLETIAKENGGMFKHVNVEE